jgi:hypothetical protein
VSHARAWGSLKERIEISMPYKLKKRLETDLANEMKCLCFQRESWLKRKEEIQMSRCESAKVRGDL